MYGAMPSCDWIGGPGLDRRLAIVPKIRNEPIIRMIRTIGSMGVMPRTPKSSTWH